MADTRIEWADKTWNPIRARNKATGRLGWHCETVSEGCRNCYAGTMNAWRGTRLPYKPGHRDAIELVLDEKALLAPLSWRKPATIFPCSMSDLFADFVPDAWIDETFAVMAASQRHRFLVLTKRSSRMRAYVSSPELSKRIARAWCKVGRNLRDRHPGWSAEAWKAAGAESTPRCWPLPNVWLGVSCEDQTAANARIPDVLATPAAIRFVSAEPLLGPIKFKLPLGGGWYDTLGGWRDVRERFPGFDEALDWIIVGGENGPRPMHPQWAREIRDQCAAAGVPFFFKQWGTFLPEGQPTGKVIGKIDFWKRRYCTLEDGDDRYTPTGRAVHPVGKKRSGRLLDGASHDAMPARIAS